jgi:hypothetical protein
VQERLKREKSRNGEQEGGRGIVYISFVGMRGKEGKRKRGFREK